MHWLNWHREAEWTGYTTTERLNGLVILGQGGEMY